MKPARPFALLVLAAVPCITWAQANNIYRCGNSYSASPCPGSVAVDVQDSRTRSQTEQSQAATQRERQAATALEKERLKEEAVARTAAPPAANTTPQKVATATKPRHKPAKAPAYFTAKSPTDPKAAQGKNKTDAEAAR